MSTATVALENLAADVRATHTNTPGGIPGGSEVRRAYYNGLVAAYKDVEHLIAQHVQRNRKSALTESWSSEIPALLEQTSALGFDELYLRLQHRAMGVVLEANRGDRLTREQLWEAYETCWPEFLDVFVNHLSTDVQRRFLAHLREFPTAPGEHNGPASAQQKN